MLLDTCVDEGHVSNSCHHDRKTNQGTSGDVEAGTLQGREQALFDAAKKIEALEIAPFDGTVAEVLVSTGAQVQVEALLVRVAAD